MEISSGFGDMLVAWTGFVWVSGTMVLIGLDLNSIPGIKHNERRRWVSVRGLAAPHDERVSSGQMVSSSSKFRDCAGNGRTSLALRKFVLDGISVEHSIVIGVP